MGLIVGLVRLILRLLALAALLVSIAALAVGVYLLVDGRDIGAVAGELWVEIDRPSLELLQAVIERYVAPVIFYPDVWFDVFAPMLHWPAWQTVLAVFAGFGLAGLILWRLAGIGRGRRAT